MRPPHRLRVPSLAAALVASLALAACGGDGDDGPDPATAADSRTVPAVEQPGRADAARPRPEEPETAEDRIQRRVFTTEAGTTIVRTVDDATGLKIEAQNDNLYVEPTSATPADLTGRLEGRPLGARCRTRDGRTLDTFPLFWRERSSDWGVSLAVLDRWEDEDRLFAEAVASCELRQGTPAGSGRTDVAAGPVLVTGTFTE
ncbi:unannotated protein [freshwater metagenome]|uniref:Unannotated protein n=1 Tax=freshwater metagenome TaxID=449393 RepID=A0A6J7K740_9ZZZZ|nr:hypothetical protein [Actinomycetota bacterium]